MSGRALRLMPDVGQTESEGRVKTRVTVLFVHMLAFFLLVGAAESQAPEARTYSHAYYLFIAPPADVCESCYIPLLLTSKPLDELARENQDQTCVVITTYERDSIVTVERAVPVSPDDVKTKERHIRFRGRVYRYQEISAMEVLRLLEHPEGTIPIHRTIGTPSRDALEDLVASFRTVK
jgi:hypothetical protein